MKYNRLFIISLLVVCAFPTLAISSTPEEQDISYPKAIILVNYYIDNFPQPSNTPSTQIESRFISQKFDVIDNTQIKRLIERDVELYSSPDQKPIAQATITTKTSGERQLGLMGNLQGEITNEISGIVYSFKDPDKVARLARGIGADILILGTVVCNIKETSRPYGITTYTYEAQVDIKAISADSARVLGVNTFRGIGRDSGRLTAADKALQVALDAITDSFITKIGNTWNSSVQGQKRIELICYNATFEKSKELRGAILNIKSVKRIIEKSLINNVLELEIELGEVNDNFADSLSELSGPKIEITSKAADKIYLRFK